MYNKTPEERTFFRENIWYRFVIHKKIKNIIKLGI